jgi:hypothetical protein
MKKVYPNWDSQVKLLADICQGFEGFLALKKDLYGKYVLHRSLLKKPEACEAGPKVLQ